jgi:preprotein translocase subunit SecA
MPDNASVLKDALLVADEVVGHEKEHANLTESALRQHLENVLEQHRILKVEIDLSKALIYLRALCGLLSKAGQTNDPHRLQIAAAAALFKGAVIDMANGEGKTLAGALAAALRAKIGMKVHIATFNDYLVRRDATWMWPLYQSLGLSVAALEPGASEGLLAKGPHLDDLEPISVKEAYQASILYAEKTRLGHDFLRDNLITAPSKRCQGPLDFVLIDEVDSVLIDDARTPLIINGTAETFDINARAEAYRRAWELSSQLVAEQHYRAALHGG